MSYRLEDLYHFAVTDEVTEEMARQAAEQAVRQQMDDWMRNHPDYTLQGIFTAGCCAGRTIKRTINEHIKKNGKEPIQD